MLRLVRLTQRRLGIVVVIAAVYPFGQGVQGHEEEHSSGNKLEAGEHGVRCLLGDLDRVRGCLLLAPEHLSNLRERRVRVEKVELVHGLEGSLSTNLGLEAPRGKTCQQPAAGTTVHAAQGREQ